jgi:transcriptional regulator with XRE-family HTH domain
MTKQRSRPRRYKVPSQSGKSLQLLRKIAKMSQPRVARAAGVDTTFISLLERDERDLSRTGVDIVRRLAGVFNLTSDELLELTARNNHGTK